VIQETFLEILEIPDHAFLVISSLLAPVVQRGIIFHQMRHLFRDQWIDQIADREVVILIEAVILVEAMMEVVVRDLPLNETTVGEIAHLHPIPESMIVRERALLLVPDQIHLQEILLERMNPKTMNLESAPKAMTKSLFDKKKTQAK
jgi:hypothetical protein